MKFVLFPKATLIHIITFNGPEGVRIKGTFFTASRPLDPHGLSKWWSPWPPCGARASPETEDQLEGSGRGCGERWWWLHLWPWWWRWIQARLSTFRPTVARKTVCIRGGHWACLTLSALSLWKEGFLGSFQVLKASKFPRMLNPSQRGGHGYGHVSLSYPHATVTSDL